MSAPTPRTDAQAGWAIANQYGQSTGSELLGDSNGVFVHAVFARKLERELTALTAERDQLRAEVQAQCLLNAKGSEREASLLGRLARAEREIVMLRAANIGDDPRAQRK